MYSWYSAAEICYVYLADVPSAEAVLAVPGKWEFDRSGIFERSRWFTRGWTLQELIAPDVVEFYAADWTEIGTKESLANILVGITGIDSKALRGSDPSLFNLAERMSWAARRVTTRPEDAAYCLLGIFGVNMPLIYGEGPRAFLRLLESILRTHQDYTIISWGLKDRIWTLPILGANTARNDSVGPVLSLESAEALVHRSLSSFYRKPEYCSPLPTGCSDFRCQTSWRYSNLGHSHHVLRMAMTAAGMEYTPPTLTSGGLLLWMLLWECSQNPLFYIAYLNCDYNDAAHLCIVITRSPGSLGSDVFSRCFQESGEHFWLDRSSLDSFTPRRIYLATYTPVRRLFGPQVRQRESLGSTLLIEAGDTGTQVVPGWGFHCPQDVSLQTVGNRLSIRDFPSALRCVHRQEYPFLILMQSDGCDVVPASDGKMFRQGLWDPIELSKLWRSLIGPQPSFDTKDRVRKRIGGNLTVDVAYKKSSKGTILKITVLGL